MLHECRKIISEKWKKTHKTISEIGKLKTEHSWLSKNAEKIRKMRKTENSLAKFDLKISSEKKKFEKILESQARELEKMKLKKEKEKEKEAKKRQKEAEKRQKEAEKELREKAKLDKKLEKEREKEAKKLQKIKLKEQKRLEKEKEKELRELEKEREKQKQLEMLKKMNASMKDFFSRGEVSKGLKKVKQEEENLGFWGKGLGQSPFFMLGKGRNLADFEDLLSFQNFKGGFSVSKISAKEYFKSKKISCEKKLIKNENEKIVEINISESKINIQTENSKNISNIKNLSNEQKNISQIAPQNKNQNLFSDPARFIFERRENSLKNQILEGSGRWGRRSKIVTGRSPLLKDEQLIHYDLDTDEEIMEGEGESCKSELLEDEEDDLLSQEDKDFLVADEDCDGESGKRGGKRSQLRAIQPKLIDYRRLGWVGSGSLKTGLSQGNLDGESVGSSVIANFQKENGAISHINSTKTDFIKTNGVKSKMGKENFKEGQKNEIISSEKHGSKKKRLGQLIIHSENAFWAIKGLSLNLENRSNLIPEKELLIKQLKTEQKENKTFSLNSQNPKIISQHKKTNPKITQPETTISKISEPHLQKIETETSENNQTPNSNSKLETQLPRTEIEVQTSTAAKAEATETKTATTSTAAEPNIMNPLRPNFAGAIRLDRLRLPFGRSYFKFRKNLRESEPPKPPSVKKSKKEVFKPTAEQLLDWVKVGFGATNKKCLKGKILEQNSDLKMSQLKDEFLEEWRQVYFGDIRVFREFFGEEKGKNYFFKCMFGSQKKLLLQEALNKPVVEKKSEILKVVLL